MKPKNLTALTVSAGKRTRSFTLLEVVIAMTIMVIGLTGIMAIFPTALKQASVTVMDSYAAIITQSVTNAITVGIRESRYQEPSSEGWDYFIFDHDGVTDELDFDPVRDKGKDFYKIAFKKDFCILLPRGLQKNEHFEEEIVMSYPTPTYKEHTQRRFLPKIDTYKNLDCSGKDFRFKLLNGTGPYTDGTDVAITRVYRLGRKVGSNGIRPQDVIRTEYLGDEFDGERIIVDPYPQYSFAFTFQRARLDTGREGDLNKPDGALSEHDRFSDLLYDVRVLVFRNYQDLFSGVSDKNSKPNLEIPPSNIPIFEIATLVSK